MAPIRNWGWLNRLAAAPDTRIDLYAYVTAGNYRHNGDYSTGLTHGQQQHVQKYKGYKCSPARLTASKAMVHVLGKATGAR